MYVYVHGRHISIRNYSLPHPRKGPTILSVPIMDLEDWEFLSDDGFIDLHEDGRKNIYPKEEYSISTTNSIVDMNYFHRLIEHPQKGSVPPNTKQKPATPVPICPSIPIDDDDVELAAVKEVTAEDVSVLPKSKSTSSEAHEKQIIPMDAVPNVEVALDLETLPYQVFFNQMKETNQFVDMKLDLPKSENKGILPHTDVGVCQSEEKAGHFANGGDEDTHIEMERQEKEDSSITRDGADDKSNLWKVVGKTGIGALFSFGFACATTVCIVALGGHQQREKQHRHRGVHFQVFGDDKIRKQVVRHASKLDEALYAVRGGPVTGAQIIGCFEI